MCVFFFRSPLFFLLPHWQRVRQPGGAFQGIVNEDASKTIKTEGCAPVLFAAVFSSDWYGLIDCFLLVLAVVVFRWVSVSTRIFGFGHLETNGWHQYKQRQHGTRHGGKPHCKQSKDIQGYFWMLTICLKYPAWLPQASPGSSSYLICTKRPDPVPKNSRLSDGRSPGNIQGPSGPYKFTWPTETRRYKMALGFQIVRG